MQVLDLLPQKNPTQKSDHNFSQDTLETPEKTQGYRDMASAGNHSKSPCNLPVTRVTYGVEGIENTKNKGVTSPRPKEWDSAFDTLLEMTEYVNEKSVLFPCALNTWKNDSSFDKLEENIDRMMRKILSTNHQADRQKLRQAVVNACRFYARKFNALCKEQHL